MISILLEVIDLILLGIQTRGRMFTRSCCTFQGGGSSEEWAHFCNIEFLSMESSVQQKGECGSVFKLAAFFFLTAIHTYIDVHVLKPFLVFNSTHQHALLTSILRHQNVEEMGNL